MVNRGNAEGKTAHRRNTQSPSNRSGRLSDSRVNQTDELPSRYRIWLGRIIAAGTRGATLDELSQQSGLPANRFSGRISELKKLGLVKQTQQRRPTRKGSTAAVVMATDQAYQRPRKHHDFSSKRHRKHSSTLPDAITNAATPHDEEGNLILHGERYVIPDAGLVEVYYEITEDEYYIYRPGTPEKRQPVSLLPPQRKPWHHAKWQ